MQSTEKSRILSGIQSSGELHLGNYFGAIRLHMQLQEQYPGECLFFIADYHALTTVHDGDRLRSYVHDVAIAYLASGLDPQKALLFCQSDVPEVTELTWLLSTVTGMGLLERAHSYKDKVSQGIKASVGLFTYPILMAADILLYQSTLVPVGKDQIQHVEMAQDMATYFNQAYSPKEPILVRPEYQLSSAPWVPGIDGRKMSKSYGNTIGMFASGKSLRKRVAQIVTDSTPLGQPLDPEQCNVFAMLRLFCDASEIEQFISYYRTGTREGQPFGFGHAKQMLTAKIEEHFHNARNRRDYFLNHPQQVEQILQESAQKARALAQATMMKCKQACGLR